LLNRLSRSIDPKSLRGDLAYLRLQVACDFIVFVEKVNTLSCEKVVLVLCVAYRKQYNGDSMSKKFALSTEQEHWLKDNHSKFTNAHLARQLGCCVDTLKRIMMKMELAYFPGAKYHYRSKPKVWSRPCMICGCKKSRPINQYRCTPCHEREAASDYMWEEHYG
jgi:hypothetical protein